MTANALGFAIEGLVAVLLALTIGYCSLLNRRIVKLRADEKSLKETIVELVHASDNAQRAMAALKDTAETCRLTLGEQLGRADALSSALDAKLKTGDGLVDQLTRLAEAQAKAQEKAEEARQRPDILMTRRPDLFARRPEQAAQPQPKAAAPSSTGRAAAAAAAAEQLLARARARTAEIVP